MEPSDEALVLACRGGDDAAWEMLIQRYQQLVYTVSRRAGLDEDLATEVFQGVFAKLVEKLDELDQPSRLKAWLVTTARRETWRVSRRAWSRAASLDRGDERELIDMADGEPLLDEAIIHLEEQHLVRTAVESLDSRCRALLMLLFYQPEPPSYAEIAARIGRSEGSIGPTRARCLEKLCRLLRKHGMILVFALLLTGIGDLNRQAIELAVIPAY